MLEGIDDVPWGRLKHAHGRASDIPKYLRDLASEDEDIAYAAASFGLWDCLCHLGTLYEASRYIIPFLLELLREGHLDGKYNRCDALLYLAKCAGSANPQAGTNLIPKWLHGVMPGESGDLDMRDRLVKGTDVYRLFKNDPDPRVRWQATQLSNWCDAPLGSYQIEEYKHEPNAHGDQLPNPGGDAGAK
jgi:hypothetical protein